MEMTETQLTTIGFSSFPKGDMEQAVLVNNLNYYTTQSGVSFFKSEENPNLNVKFKEHFKDFIEARVDYLNRLKNLGDNWICGGGKQPPLDSIILSKKFLDGIKSWYLSSSCNISEPPNIIMSPIPSGGMSVELKLRGGLSLLLNIYGESSIELEKEVGGYYSDIEVSKTDFIAKVTSCIQDFGAIQKGY